MAFTDHLTASARLVEDRLNALLGRRESAPARLGAAMRHAVLGGGKRFRPFLVLESAALFGIGAHEALDVAAAVELVHCYSLVHDDLPAMDDDDLRRGRPTVHVAYDDATAILVGDALQSLAFEVLATPAPGSRDLPEVRLELIKGLAGAAGWCGMAGGQMLDLAAENDAPGEIAGIARIQALKTGAMIRFAATAGAILGEAGASERAALDAFGQAIGLAFQIADDLLDVEGDATLVGKATAKDRRAGKATFVSLLGPEAARAKLGSMEDRAVAALAPFGSRAKTLADAAHFVATRRY